MTDIRFIRKDGQSVDLATVRQRFFESAMAAKVNPQRAGHIWNSAMLGEPYARDKIEELCGIEIVRADAGFGFRE